MHNRLWTESVCLVGGGGEGGATLGHIWWRQGYHMTGTTGTSHAAAAAAVARFDC
jgi:hypothetical protein